MSEKDIWYGVLEAGEKTSPVVRDISLEASQNKIYLYNFVRNEFVEYAQAIVEPKLRDLKSGDIKQDELDKAFKAARQAFMSSRKVRAHTDSKPVARRAKDDDDDDVDDFDMSDDDETEEFIDDED